MDISDAWRFIIDVDDLGEKERWYDPGHDRSKWASVPAPKAWDLYDEALWGYEGIGWYARTLDGSCARVGRIQRLHFDRVKYSAKVWLNGKLMGEIRKPRGAPARSPPKRGSGPAARPRSPAGPRTTTDPVIPGELCSADPPPPRTSKAQPGQAPEHRIPPALRPHLPIDFALCEVPRPRGRAFAEVHDRATSPTAALFWISRDSAQLSRAS